MEHLQSHRGSKEVSPTVRAEQLHEKREPVDPAFEAAIEKGIKAALNTIHQRFENTGDRDIESKKGPNDNLEFHNTHHTRDVMRRTRLILEAMGASERRVRLGELIAAYHDTVQKYEEDSKADGSILRKRSVRYNEAASVGELLRYISEHAGSFTDEEIEACTSGIENTVPDWDPGNKTVMQPNLMEGIEKALAQELTADSPELVERAVALADLGTAGIDGPQTFLPEGDAIFREENLDIPTSLNDPEKRAFITDRMLRWSKVQIDFAKGRKARLESELKGLPEPMAEKVWKLFDKFDDSIQAAEKQFEARKAMTFEALATDFGYLKHTVQ